MAERELYPDAEQRRRIMDFIMAAGQTLLENGAEVFRVEQTMEIMAASFHLREFHVYVLTNGIFASAGTAEMSEVRNVPTRTTHLGRVAAVNQFHARSRPGKWIPSMRPRPGWLRPGASLFRRTGCSLRRAWAACSALR